MIFTETLESDGITLIKTYSDKYTLLQNETGIVYEDAIDIPNKYTYSETEDFNLVYKLQLEKQNDAY